MSLLSSATFGSSLALGQDGEVAMVCRMLAFLCFFLFFCAIDRLHFSHLAHICILLGPWRALRVLHLMTMLPLDRQIPLRIVVFSPMSTAWSEYASCLCADSSCCAGYIQSCGHVTLLRIHGNMLLLCLPNRSDDDHSTPSTLAPRARPLT